MQSTSASDGSYSLIVTFAIGTDPNMAQVLVQNRVASALAQLPQSVQVQGVTVQKKSTAVLHVRHADLAGQAATTACSWRTTASSICRTSSRGCRAWATSRSSAPASMPCASGWTRTSCRPSA